VGGHSVAVEALDEGAVAVDAVVRLVGSVEALLRDRLEPEEQGLAATPRRELQELLVPGGVERALARPPLPERGEGPEEVLGVARVGPDVVVPEDDGARRGTGDLGNDLGDRTVANPARAVEERDRAVVAAVGAAARRDRDRLPVVSTLDEVPPGEGMPARLASPVER